MPLDKLIPFYEFIAYFVALLSGWLICSEFSRGGYRGGESRMRAKLLLQLLQMSPEGRSDRILDLFFFVLSDKTNEVPEVSPSRRRNFPLEIKENWNIPTVERPMGFEKEISRVQKLIEEYKKGMSSLKAKMAENTDLEKGL
ncbi:hypothetical protein BOTNAR_0768g00020 [Botryotinia narcissicola]|uniref:Uncharacterized protein n=1 Tax=Botryotinia narcissicola TaxID=278944 RepID=A0A4Z1H788_9HELO|nr:hypothetical protein BOTNAR_0768g00020 [Botryotinia narcissicola]